MSILLDFLIGMALLYLLIAVVSSFVFEIGTSWLNIRGKRLKQLLAQLIANDPNGTNGKWLQDFYAHPQIQALHLPTLRTGTGSPPSYIPAQRFASSVIDLLRKAAGLAPGKALDMPAIREALIAANRVKELEAQALAVLNGASSSPDSDAHVKPLESKDKYLKGVDDISAMLPARTDALLTGQAVSDALSDTSRAATLPQGLGAFLQSALADGPRSVTDLKTQLEKTFELLKKAADALGTNERKNPAELHDQVKQLAAHLTGYLPDGLRATLASALASGAETIEDIQQALEASFDATMERATGWYKRFAQVCLMILAFILALLFNLDSLYVGERLLHDPQLRGIAVQTATQIAPPDGSATLADLERRVRNRLVVAAADVDAALAQSEIAMNMEAKSKEAKDKEAKEAAENDRQGALEQLRKTAGILLAGIHFNPIDAAADRAFLDTTDPARAFALIDDPRLAPAPPAVCPATPATPKPGASASEWITYIRCQNDQSDRSADIKAFQASDALCIAPTRIIDATLCKLLLPVIRTTPVPDTNAIRTLNGHLQTMKASQDALDKQLDSALDRLPKIGWWLDDLAGKNPGRFALLGWLITALMAGFGAPLWFELLGKLVNLRSTGLKPEEQAAKNTKPASSRQT